MIRETVTEPALTRDAEGASVGNLGMIMDITFPVTKRPGIQDN